MIIQKGPTKSVYPTIHSTEITRKTQSHKFAEPFHHTQTLQFLSL